MTLLHGRACSGISYEDLNFQDGYGPLDFRSMTATLSLNYTLRQLELNLADHMYMYAIFKGFVDHPSARV